MIILCYITLNSFGRIVQNARVIMRHVVGTFEHFPPIYSRGKERKQGHPFNKLCADLSAEKHQVSEWRIINGT